MFLAQIIYQNQIFKFNSYPDFIQHLRHFAFGNHDFSIQVQLNEIATPLIWVRAADLYLLGVQDQGAFFEFPEINYAEENIAINLQALYTVFKSLVAWCEENKFLPSCHLKLLSFFISEAARFRMVEKVNLAVLEGVPLGNAENWTHWAPLLKSWSAIAKGKMAYSKNHLMLPISISDATLFFGSRNKKLIDTFAEMAPQFDSDEEESSEKILPPLPTEDDEEESGKTLPPLPTEKSPSP